MKKIAIGLFFLTLCAICGIGAFFFLRQGEAQWEEERQPARLIGLSDVTIRAGEALPSSILDIQGTAAVKEASVDTSAVCTGRPGKYPIYYRYTDQGGKEFTATVQCTVKGAGPLKGADALSGQAQPGDGESPLPPKTGDEGAMAGWAALATLSLGSIGSILAYRKKHSKI